MVIFCPKMRPDNSKVTVILVSILFTLYDAEFGDLRGEELKNEVPNYSWCGAHYGGIVAILEVAVMFTLSQVGWQEIRLSCIFQHPQKQAEVLGESRSRRRNVFCKVCIRY